ncbi:MAG: TRAP transporter large permease subunit, partial [Planctomycetota bacterium]
LFTFAGYLMAESGTPRRLVRVSRAWLGWLPGALPIVCLLASAFFTTFTGGSGITIVAIGGLLYPALIADEYSERFSLGMITTGGSLGLLFPPSLPIVLFAVVAGLEVEKLFLAGIVPGVVSVLAMVAFAVFVGRRAIGLRFSLLEAGVLVSCLAASVVGFVFPDLLAPFHLGRAGVVYVPLGFVAFFSYAAFVQWKAGKLRGPSAVVLALGGPVLYVVYVALRLRGTTDRERERILDQEVMNPAEAAKSLFVVLPELMLPVLLIIALVVGVLRIHEAAAFTALYVFVVEVFVHRDVSFKKDLPRIVEESMTLVGAILAILATAIGFTGFLIQDQLPMKILAAMSEYISGPIMFLLVLNAFLLVVGMLMDIFSAIVVVVPLILPIAREFGMTAENGGLYYL